MFASNKPLQYGPFGSEARKQNDIGQYPTNLTSGLANNPYTIK